MSLLFADHLNYASVTEMSRVYPAGSFASNMTSQFRYFVRNAYNPSSANTGSFVLPASIAQGTTIIFTGAIRHTAFDNQHFLRFIESSTVHAAFYRTAAGGFEIRRNTTVVETISAAPHFRIDAWHVVEIKFSIGDSVAVTIKVDGVQIYTNTGLDLQNGGTGNVDRFNLSTANFCDVVLCDGNGSFNNDFIGEQRVSALFPDGTSSAQWTPSTGTNHATIDDPTMAATPTDYNESNTTGHVDLLTYGNLPADVGGAPSAVLVGTRSHSTSAPQSFRARISSNSNVENGATRVLDGTSTNRFDIFEQDPDGPGAWSISAVNALLAGYEVVSA